MKSASAPRAGLSKRELRRVKERAAKRSRRFFAVGTISLVVLFALAVALTRSGNDAASTDGTLQTRNSSITGETLPDFTDTGSDSAVGMEVPRVSGESFDGDPVRIAPDGRPKVLIFLAHWCPHCQAEVPAIQSWLEAEGMPYEVELLSVSTAVDPTAPNYPPSEWLDREGWDVPVIADDGGSSIGRAFGVSSYPYFVFVDAAGRVVHRASGELPIEEIESQMTHLLR